MRVRAAPLTAAATRTRRGGVAAPRVARFAIRTRACGGDLRKPGTMASDGPACKADAAYNFGSASSRDELVYGAARPGARSQRCFNPDDKVTEDEIHEWAAFMKEHGINRVVGLLSSSERSETYATAPVDTLRASGLSAVNIDLEADAEGGAAAALKEIEDAVAAKEKVVVHCWGGGGRCGRMLATYLVAHYGMPAADAAAEVSAHAKAQGAKRRVDIPELEIMAKPWLGVEK